MADGRVKWFNSQERYGFIQPKDRSNDVFVHKSTVERSGMGNLHEGQKRSAMSLRAASRARSRPSTCDQPEDGWMVHRPPALNGVMVGQRSSN